MGGAGTRRTRERGRQMDVKQLMGTVVDALYDGKSEQFIETRVRFEDGRVGSVSATIKLMDAATHPAAAASPALSKQAA